jgi:hypothetical protein
MEGLGASYAVTVTVDTPAAAADDFSITVGRHKQQQSAIVAPVEGSNDSSMGDDAAVMASVSRATKSSHVDVKGISTLRVCANISSAGFIGNDDGNTN